MTGSLIVSPSEQDAKLDHVDHIQKTYKPGVILDIMCGILKVALRVHYKNPPCANRFWPDDPELVTFIQQLAGKDKNCVGTAWRRLGEGKLLVRCLERKKSTAAMSNGRGIARWEIINALEVIQFLEAHSPGFRYKTHYV